MSNSETSPLVEPVQAPKRRIAPAWIFLGVLLLVVIVGSAAGYFSGQALHAEQQQSSIHTFDVEQYLRASDDILAGNYRVAVERLDAILKNEPGFPGAAQLREQALTAMNATPTPLPTNTPVPSPTLDAPRAEQLVSKAKQEFVDKKYMEMIETLLTLKVEVPTYHPEQVDGLLWAALRYNGVHLIKETNRLTEGMYYLDLASNYAPLDKEAADQMEAAKYFLTIYQSAYYYRNKDIEESWKYFKTVVGTRRYYSDVLVLDYVKVLVQNGDAWKNQNDCRAWWFYDQALVEMPDYQPAIDGRAYSQQNCGESAPTPPEGYEVPSGETPPSE
jgi:hypothetical protein